MDDELTLGIMALVGKYRNILELSLLVIGIMIIAAMGIKKYRWGKKEKELTEEKEKWEKLPPYIQKYCIDEMRKKEKKEWKSG